MLRILGLSTVTFNDIVERIGITMLNAFLFYSITNILNFHNFLFFGMGIVIILSALLPYVLAPALTLIYILGYNFSSLFLSSTNTITLPMLERAVLMIIFFFIVPILVQIKYTSLQGFLTTESMLGSIISPVFIGTGVSEKGRDPKSNVISALPALYIIVFKVLNSLPAFSISSILYPSIGLVLLILSSILFTRRSLISLVGVIPLYPGISLVLGLDYLSPYVIVASLLGLAVNAIPSVINFTRTLSQNKSTIEKEKREMISQIEDKVRLINNIKGGSVNLPVEFVEVLSEAESSLKSQLAKVNSCIDNDCVTESFKEFQSVQESVDKMINDAVFKIVIDYNNVVNNIRKLGVNAEEIPIPPVLKLNELDVNTIVRILNTIDRNIYYTTNKVNQILEGVEKTVGGKYSRILVTDYKSLDKISAILGDQVIRKGTEECLAIQADVVRELRLSPLNDQRIVLSKKINQVMIENFSLDKINNIVSITDEHIALLKKNTSNSYRIKEMK